MSSFLSHESTSKQQQPKSSLTSSTSFCDTLLNLVMPISLENPSSVRQRHLTPPNSPTATTSSIINHQQHQLQSSESGVRRRQGQQEVTSPDENYVNIDLEF